MSYLHSVCSTRQLGDIRFQLCHFHGRLVADYRVLGSGTGTLLDTSHVPDGQRRRQARILAVSPPARDPSVDRERDSYLDHIR